MRNDPPSTLHSPRYLDQGPVSTDHDSGTPASTTAEPVYEYWWTVGFHRGHAPEVQHWRDRMLHRGGAQVPGTEAISFEDSAAWIGLYLGPLIVGEGPVRFTYQDAHHSLIFRGDEVRTVDVPDLGTIVSVTLIRTVDLGYTSFSLLVPQVTLPPQLTASATISTDGITTVHRTFLAALGHAQTETYALTRLTGTALIGMLSL